MDFDEIHHKSSSTDELTTEPSMYYPTLKTVPILYLFPGLFRYQFQNSLSSSSHENPSRMSQSAEIITNDNILSLSQSSALILKLITPGETPGKRKFLVIFKSQHSPAGRSAENLWILQFPVELFQ